MHDDASKASVTTNKRNKQMLKSFPAQLPVGRNELRDTEDECVWIP
jgi:hypothetical protein